MKAAAALVPKMDAKDAGQQFKEAKRRDTVDAAVDAFLQSPEGQTLARSTTPPVGADLMKKVKEWVDKEAPTKPETAKFKSAIDESVGNPAMAAADAERMQGKLQKLRATFYVAPEEKEEGLLESNMKGGMGGLIGGILGMIVGGPIGALLGALLGFAIGGSQDKKGLLSGLFNPGCAARQSRGAASRRRFGHTGSPRGRPHARRPHRRQG
ncbi:MAG: hypothetical protein EBV03_12955 [Proteobacteria bacterium]|nr:hypothetical protein [Pseudomonadota bacterium]